MVSLRRKIVIQKNMLYLIGDFIDKAGFQISTHDAWRHRYGPKFWDHKCYKSCFLSQLALRLDENVAPCSTTVSIGEHGKSVVEMTTRVPQCIGRLHLEHR